MDTQTRLLSLRVVIRSLRSALRWANRCAHEDTILAITAAIASAEADMQAVSAEAGQ